MPPTKRSKEARGIKNSGSSASQSLEVITEQIDRQYLCRDYSVSQETCFWYLFTWILF